MNTTWEVCRALADVGRACEAISEHVFGDVGKGRLGGAQVGGVLQTMARARVQRNEADFVFVFRREVMLIEEILHVGDDLINGYAGEC